MFEPIFKRNGYRLSLESDDWRKSIGSVSMSVWVKINNRGQALLHFFARDNNTGRNITQSTLIDKSVVEATLLTLEDMSWKFIRE